MKRFMALMNDQNPTSSKFTSHQNNENEEVAHSSLGHSLVTHL